MKYGIYREDAFTTALFATTIDATKAEKMATELAFDDKATFIVVVLGPKTPDTFELRDPFRPRVIFRTERL